MGLRESLKKAVKLEIMLLLGLAGAGLVFLTDRGDIPATPWHNIGWLASFVACLCLVWVVGLSALDKLFD